MSKNSRVHFLTAYLEFLYDQGIKSEYYYIGDASRYLRYLLARSGPAEIEGFLSAASSPAYRRRLIKTLRKFYAFAGAHLDIASDAIDRVDPRSPPSKLD